MVQSRNYYYSSIKVVSINEKKTANKRLLWLIQTICPNNTTLNAGKQMVPSAEVGALGPMFEKSATELKLKPILLRYKDINI